MNKTHKIAASFFAVAAFSAIIFTTANADSMKPSQASPAVAATSAQSVVAPLNSKETPQDQLKDMQY